MTVRYRRFTVADALLHIRHLRGYPPIGQQRLCSPTQSCGLPIPLLHTWARKKAVGTGFEMTPITQGKCWVISVLGDDICCLISEAAWQIYSSLNWVIIGSGNGLSLVRRQATMTLSVLFFFKLKLKTFSQKKMRLKRINAKCQPSRLALSVIFRFILACRISLPSTLHNHHGSGELPKCAIDSHSAVLKMFGIFAAVCINKTVLWSTPTF